VSESALGKRRSRNMELRQNWSAGKIQEFCVRLLNWYRIHRRALPWRSKPTPYRVWVSEIMLQQTQAKTVIPYFNRFVKRFPDIESLAQAKEREILELWSGLGYYSRARNLHRAARQIVKNHGVFPGEFKAVLALPGVGRYTAGAICSIAYNQAQPVVDGNVRRVLARLGGVRERLPESFYWNQMSIWLPAGKASSFNQAVMELGALICVPSQPLCPQCPVEDFCEARRYGIQNTIPEARARRTPKHLRMVTLVLQHGDKILLTSLGKYTFIPGKWGLPCRIVPDRESIDEAASSLCGRVLGHAIPLAPCPRIRHSISHYRLLVCGFLGKTGLPIPWRQETGSYRWMHFSQDRTLLTSSLFRKVLQKCEELGQDSGC
jgi:A/G-specific adenine glycosylase